MVVPSLRSHLNRNKQTYGSNNSCHYGTVELQVFANKVDDGCHANTAPNGIRIEGACISVVALTRLLRCLVQIDYDSQTRHEEQEEHHPELAYTAASAPSLPEETDETEQQGETIEHVVSLVVFQFVG